MLETLAKGFRAARQKLTGKAELDDDVIDEALREVRLSLLEADVEFRVVKRLLDRVKEAARGEQVVLKAKSQEYGVKSITPEQAFVKICQDELAKMMGPVDTELRWAKKGATGIMVVGLVGGWLFDNWKPVGPFLYMAASNATLFGLALLTMFFTRKAPAAA